MINVCLVAPFPPPYGGIANWTKMLIKKSPTNRLKITLINTAPLKRVTENRTLFDRIIVSGFKMLFLGSQLKTKIQSAPIDIIHITTSGQLAIIRDIWLMKIAKKVGIPVCYHIRFGRIPEIYKNNTLEWKIMKKAFHLSNAIWCLDEKTFVVLQKEFKGKVTKIPNPIDLDNIPYPSEQTPKKYIVFVGWVIKEKGVEELLGAWETIQQLIPGWQLLFIGPYAKEYRTKLEKEFNQNGVSFLGEQSHSRVFDYISNAEIFVLPSHTEGFPNVILEAMALKKAIIATNVGAVADMLSNECGIVVPSQESNELREKILMLMENPMLRLQLGENAHQKVLEEYSFEKILNTYINRWQSLL